MSVGEIKVSINGKSEYYATGGGFAEIFNNSVKLLVESLEKSNELTSIVLTNLLKEHSKGKLNQIPKLIMLELKHL